MEGIIVNFRRGRHTQYSNQMIVKVEGVESKKKALSMIKKTVTWSCPGKKKKEIKGTVNRPHGNKGALRVRFEYGMPGQSIGTKVKIM